MTRRLLTILAIASLLVLTVASPAAAGRRWDKPIPPVRTDNQADCGSPNGWRDFAGMENGTSNLGWKRSGISASVAISDTGFDICTNGGLSSIKGVSAWVGIEPYNSSPPCFGSCANNIIQLGVIECRDVVRIGSPCYGENSPRFFWAWGGCNVFNVPLPQDIGPADYGLHSFALWLDTDDLWHFSIDGHEKKTLNDDNVDCWTTYNRSADWIVERADSGDSTGDTGNKTLLANAAYGVYGQGWFTTSWNAADPCHGATVESKCDVTSPSNLLWWTVQQ